MCVQNKCEVDVEKTSTVTTFELFLTLYRGPVDINMGRPGDVVKRRHENFLSGSSGDVI